MSRPAKPKAAKVDNKPCKVTQAIQRTRGGGPKGVDWRPAYLEALAITGMHSRASVAAGITHVTAWRERKKDPAFAAAVKEAEDRAAILLEDTAVERAVHGLRKYQFSNGQPLLHPITGEPYYEHEYSDSLLIQLLKGRMPERYREKVDVEGKVAHVHLTLAELRQRLAEGRA